MIWVNYMTLFKVSDLNVPSVVPGQSAESYKVNLKLKVGAVRVRVPKVRTIQKKFSVQTPQGIASVRGTEEVVQYSPDFGLQVQVFSGLVEVQNPTKGTQYASRGEKVAVNTHSGTAVETVNQQRRTEVEKNIQIARSTGQVQGISEEVQIIALPSVIQTPSVADLPRALRNYFTLVTQSLNKEISTIPIDKNQEQEILQFVRSSS